MFQAHNQPYLCSIWQNWNKSQQMFSFCYNKNSLIWEELNQISDYFKQFARGLRDKHGLSCFLKASPHSEIEALTIQVIGNSEIGASSRRSMQDWKVCYDFPDDIFGAFSRRQC